MENEIENIEPEVEFTLAGSARDSINKVLYEDRLGITGRFDPKEQRERVMPQIMALMPDEKVTRECWLSELVDSSISRQQGSAAQGGLRALEEWNVGGQFMIDLNDPLPVMIEPGIHVPLRFASFEDIKAIIDRLTETRDAKTRQIDNLKDLLGSLAAIGLRDGATLQSLTNHENLILFTEKAA